MVSPIEETLASLTALSGQSMLQLDDMFKFHDRKFEGFRSSTLTAIKKVFTRIESEAQASHSPAKSLRKQTRRKLKKSTRTRKTKQKPHAQLPNLIDTIHRTSSHNRIPSQSFLSRPLPDALKEARIEAESEIPVNSPLLQSQPIPAKPPGTSDDNFEKRTSAAGKLSSKRFTRSTTSFRSAIGSPIQDDPKDKTTLDRHYDGHPTQDISHSPETGEAQWEDCRTKPEPTLPLRMATSNRLILDSNGFAIEEPANVAPNIGKLVPIENESLLKAPLLDKGRGAAPKNVRQLLDTKPINHGTPCEASTVEEEDANSLSSDPEQQDRSRSEIEQATPAPVPRRKQGAKPIITNGELLQDIGDLKETEEKFSVETSSTDADTASRMSKERSNHQNYATPFEDPTGKASSTSEQIKKAEAKTKGSRPDHISNMNFEFKAPKPKLIVPSETRQHEFELDVHRTSDLHQTPDSEIQKSKSSDALKNRVFQKHFAVDEEGKITDTGVGLLSEIVATSSQGNETGGLKNGGERTLRGTKLFNPTTDIYSAQRKPVLSRVLSIQKSNMSSRDSLLSHTPGAHAPTTGLAQHALLAGPSNNSLRESLAALKQPITDSNPTQPKLDRKPSNEVASKGRPNSLHHSDEQGSLIPRGDKRLTFADGYKQFSLPPSQSSRALGSNTSPTKAFRQPRIRREAEKSALRRRIEEIRGKASASIAKKNISPRSSSNENLLENSSAGNRDSGKSDVKQVTSGISETLQSPKQTRMGSAGHSVGYSEPKTSREAIGSVLLTESEQQKGLAQVEVSMTDDEGKYALNNEESARCELESENRRDDRRTSGMVVSHGEDEDETGKAQGVESSEEEARVPKNLLSNLMCSVSSLYPSSLLGVRTNEERREETDGEVAAKRQRLDAERREAERLARIEGQRAARQREAEEKQRRAEARRQLLAEAEKAKEDERKRKEEHRKKVKQQEEEQRRRKKMEEDRKKEERRKQVLEKKAMNMGAESKRKGVDGKHQRHVKGLDRGVTGIPKPGGLGGKTGKGGAMAKGCGKRVDTADDGKDNEDMGMSSYMMTPAKETVIEESDEETERRRSKVIPQWAGERNLAISTRSQPDPDKVFVNMPMCNLRDVFGNSKQYRTRSSSANWTQDRVRTSEMTKYKKAVGGFRDV